MNDLREALHDLLTRPTDPAARDRARQALMATEGAPPDGKSELVASLMEELASTYDELIDVNGDDMIDSRAKRAAELRAALLEGK